MGSIDFQIKLAKPDALALEVLLQEQDDRREKMMQYFLYLAAERVKEDLLKRIPAFYVDYRKSLEVVNVEDVKTGMFAVRTTIPSTTLGKVAATKTVLYVRARDVKKPDPKVAVLVQFSPWTTGTLPFIPSPRKAAILTRTVAPAVATAVEKARRADRSKWEARLRKVGARVPKRTNVLKAKKGNAFQVAADIEAEALFLEFGIASLKRPGLRSIAPRLLSILRGKRPVAHWRPAIQSLETDGVLDILKKHPEIARAIGDATFVAWRRWPPKTPVMGTKEVASYVPFMKRLGY